MLPSNIYKTNYFRLLTVPCPLSNLAGGCVGTAFSDRTIRGEGIVRSHSSSKSWGSGMGRMSSRSSKTTRVGLDGVPRTVFSRSERMVVNPDGSRNSQVFLVV